MDSRSNVRTGGLLAVGGWLAGLLYDYLGYHAPAFAVGIAPTFSICLWSVCWSRENATTLSRSKRPTPPLQVRSATDAERFDRRFAKRQDPY